MYSGERGGAVILLVLGRPRCAREKACSIAAPIKSVSSWVDNRPFYFRNYVGSLRKKLPGSLMRLAFMTENYSRTI